MTVIQQIRCISRLLLFACLDWREKEKTKQNSPDSLTSTTKTFTEVGLYLSLKKGKPLSCNMGLQNALAFRKIILLKALIYRNLKIG